MSEIINRGESLSLGKDTSIAQVRSQGGRRSAQKRGPTLYSLEVEVPAQKMNGTTHLAIEDEVIKLEYGGKTFHQATVSGVMKVNTVTKPRGTWTGSPAVDGANQTGNTVTVNNITGSVVAGDYVQFTGSTKVYQLMVGSTDTSLKLNCSLVASPTDTSLIVFGNSVNFNFALMERPATQFLAGDIVQFGKFYFEEVIE